MIVILFVDVVYKLVFMFDSLYYYVIVCVDSINMLVWFNVKVFIKLRIYYFYVNDI